MAESSPDETSSKRSDFICGVVEGFYGRPWTTDQRKDLFQKLNKWNMNMYVYAPKDDYKHRAYWRELYTVEEAEHLTSLITAAKDKGITFCYALSPGLDITYSSQKEITILKRKLEQVAQFGCTCFALLFDDIEPEMTESDKQVFQSFAHAQVSVTNEVQEHLGGPRFLLCPTQYCSARAVPAVHNSEYLNTLGSKLAPDIDIMWTGSKVVSKTLTAPGLQEVAAALRRAPVIWDNLHANDYDQKRVFLGPYCGRSPELIPLLRGVLTNPNCEYNANMIAIRTLAHWASCSLDAPVHIDSVSWDIRLEREGARGVCEDEPPAAPSDLVYHPKQALRLAIEEWLPEFSIPKPAQGPVIKPQPTIQLPPVPIIPIMPSVNTCMSIATSAVATPSQAVPTLHAAQLSALADCCAAAAPRVSATEVMNPVPNPVMNSLVSPTKVILNESIPNPIIPHANIPEEIPLSTLPVPLLGLKALEENRNGDQSMKDSDVVLGESVDEAFGDEMTKLDKDDELIVDDEKEIRNGEMSVGDTPPLQSPRGAPCPPEPLAEPPAPADSDDVVMNDVASSENGSMQVEPSPSPAGCEMLVEASDAADPADDSPEDPPLDDTADAALTADDLLLLCELFYLPFAHGARGLRLLQDYRWLSAHAPGARSKDDAESMEWRRRRCRWAWWLGRARRLSRRLQSAANQELCGELRPYVWELCGALALLDGFVRWLELGKFPSNMQSNFQATYTWFSKGWREAFESGAQEPWVFRGGLTADLRRLLPVESPGELARLPPPPAPLAAPLTVRPYTHADEEKVCSICHKTCRDGSDCSELFPADLQTLPADRLVMPFLTLTPEFCMVIEDDNDGLGAAPEVVGYACAALSSQEFYRRQEAAWVPAARRRYPAALAARADLSPAAKECIQYFHNFSQWERAPESVTRSHPALLTCCVLGDAPEPAAVPRLVTCLLAALRACGASGVHVCINAGDLQLLQFYRRLGFAELPAAGALRYLGRSF